MNRKGVSYPEKVFLIQYKCCIETRFSRSSSQEFAGFTVIVWLIQLWICRHSAFNPSRFSRYVALITPRFHSSSGVFFSLCCSYQAKISQAIRRFFYMSEIYFALVFTSLHASLSIYRSILRSCYRKFVFRCWAHRQLCRSRRCYRNREKRTATSQKPNLCFVWGTWKFAPKNIRTEKIPRQIIFISINAFKSYFARLLKRCT